MQPYRIIVLQPAQRPPKAKNAAAAAAQGVEAVWGCPSLRPFGQQETEAAP